MAAAAGGGALKSYTLADLLMDGVEEKCEVLCKELFKKETGKDITDEEAAKLECGLLLPKFREIFKQEDSPSHSRSGTVREILSYWNEEAEGGGSEGGASSESSEAAEGGGGSAPMITGGEEGGEEGGTQEAASDLFGASDVAVKDIKAEITNIEKAVAKVNDITSKLTGGARGIGNYASLFVNFYVGMGAAWALNLASAKPASEPEKLLRILSLAKTALEQNLERMKELIENVKKEAEEGGIAIVPSCARYVFNNASKVMKYMPEKPAKDNFIELIKLKNDTLRGCISVAREVGEYYLKKGKDIEKFKVFSTESEALYALLNGVSKIPNEVFRESYDFARYFGQVLYNGVLSTIELPAETTQALMREFGSILGVYPDRERRKILGELQGLLREKLEETLETLKGPASGAGEDEDPGGELQLAITSMDQEVAEILGGMASAGSKRARGPASGAGKDEDPASGAGEDRDEDERPSQRRRMDGRGRKRKVILKKKRKSKSKTRRRSKRRTSKCKVTLKRKSK